MYTRLILVTTRQSRLGSTQHQELQSDLRGTRLAFSGRLPGRRPSARHGRGALGAPTSTCVLAVLNTVY